MPAYSVRRSPKAKNVTLRVSAEKGIIAVVPTDFDEAKLPDIIAKKRQWIDRTNDRLQKQWSFLSHRDGGSRPERIVLRAIGEDWRVQWKVTSAKFARVVEAPGSTLRVAGSIASDALVEEALRRWLSRKVKRDLVLSLNSLSDALKLPIRRVFVKSQRTRWASCSRDGVVSLNTRLLFLPANLVRYVFVHELAHVVVANHTKQFWSVVRSADSAYLQHDKEMRTAWRFIPKWAEYKRTGEARNEWETF